MYTIVLSNLNNNFNFENVLQLELLFDNLDSQGYV